MYVADITCFKRERPGAMSGSKMGHFWGAGLVPCQLQGETC